MFHQFFEREVVFFWILASFYEISIVIFFDFFWYIFFRSCILCGL